MGSFTFSWDYLEQDTLSKDEAADKQKLPLTLVIATEINPGKCYVSPYLGNWQAVHGISKDNIITDNQMFSIVIVEYLRDARS